mmetsp:Transcript_14949/g.32549  ORF Transcript_14949/g.32549 Transcript_14949/m.32549 type:complete len:334 (+) Transcript_14949:100-1101(+)|eukprot:CAMPEP_0178482436 /NCGR_PEP_ID=MMETSP0696-20121128/6726_1 /TAXON_ID=265572 /ORGANISM="Extubocellulus spinifer, Strain CCMP396" /LENGTH=333 /DNA_ID=CAMNT_0020109939 /DNA_START=59 /DNA_END=1060 /DNA_ORIENTATION=+
MSTKEQEEPEEDDWSSFMCPQQAKTGFAHYENMFVSLSNNSKFHIKCVSALSPLDMIDMYHGAQDATGNRIWTGALLFLEAFARPCLPPLSPRSRDDKGYDPTEASSKFDSEEGSSMAKSSTIRHRLSKLREEAIRSKKILEMGAGTGVSGLSILLSDANVPKNVTFSDFDPAALDLCRQNCELNVIDKSRYRIQPLRWGSEQLPDDMDPELYDTVIATDVLYDIASLPPLMLTASSLLKGRGYFILSHVPRAAVQDIARKGCGSAVASVEVLTKLIVEEASKYHMCLDCSNLGIVEPTELSTLWGHKSLNEVTFEDMTDVGAAIFVFRKRSK